MPLALFLGRRLRDPMCRFTAVNADRERTPCRSLPSRDNHTIFLPSATALHTRASLAAWFLVYRGKQGNRAYLTFAMRQGRFTAVNKEADTG